MEAKPSNCASTTASGVSRGGACKAHSLHEEWKDRAVAVVGAALVHELIGHVIVVDDDDLVAQDQEVEDISCETMVNGSDTMVSTVSGDSPYVFDHSKGRSAWYEGGKIGRCR